MSDSVKNKKNRHPEITTDSPLHIREGLGEGADTTRHPKLVSGSSQNNDSAGRLSLAGEGSGVGLWPKLKELARQVKSGGVTPTELVEKSLSLIADNSEYNTVLNIMSERARELAKQIELKLKNGEDIGPLGGIPFLAKDNFLVKGEEMTASSNILKDFISPYSATSVKKLEDAGAICLGKTNLDAFAHGGSTENSDFGVTKNPYDKTRVPGGSSGGSAAAVALSLVPFALGTDTGGSIRLPASFCGVVGLKPSYGAVSRYGVVSMASSTDCIGPLASNIEDAELVLSLMAGEDPLDSTTVELIGHPGDNDSHPELPFSEVNLRRMDVSGSPKKDATYPLHLDEAPEGGADAARHPEITTDSPLHIREGLGEGVLNNNSAGHPSLAGERPGPAQNQSCLVARVRFKKIGIIKQFYGDGLQPEVKQKTLEAINKFKDAGFEVEEVNLPSLNLSLAAYYVIVPAEISSNLMRYDGIRYGLSLAEGEDLADVYADSRSGGFNAENKRRIMIGAYVLSSGYYDAYYKKAQTVRTKIINQFNEAFKKFDLLVGPVSPTTAFKIGDNAQDPLAMYLADVMTVGISLAGLPALSLPVGLDDCGMPIGLQLIAPHKQDYLLLSLSKILEST